MCLKDIGLGNPVAVFLTLIEVAGRRTSRSRPESGRAGGGPSYDVDNEDTRIGGDNRWPHVRIHRINGLAKSRLNIVQRITRITRVDTPKWILRISFAFIPDQSFHFGKWRDLDPDK